MQLNKILYDVREQLNEYTSDSEIDDRYIIYLYGIKRAKYLRQQLNNMQISVDNSILQTLCLKLEEVSANECNLDTDCNTIMRTVDKVPKPLETHLKPMLTSVKPVIRLSVPFNFGTKTQATFSKYSNFNKSIYSFLDNDGYIYVISESETVKLLDCITVTGVFEDPLELSNYSNCCGCDTPKPCFDEMESDYPLQPHYIDLIREEIVNSFLNKKKTPEDKENNSNDN
jgi:hypothetical protein